MKKVIVLMDDENRQSDYINNISFGKDPFLSTMCRMPTEAELKNQKKFIYEVFGLNTNDIKLDNFLLKHDGIIIAIETNIFKNNTSTIMTQLKKITEKYSKIPIQIVFEHEQSEEFEIVKNIKYLCNKYLVLSKVHKYFITQYQKNTGSLIEDRSVKMYFYNTNYDTYLDLDMWFNKMLYNENKQHITIETNELSSKTIQALQLMDQFYNATLPIHLWDHYGRLRVVWCSIIKFGFEKTIDKNGWLCNSWKKYKTSIGHGDKWNYTLTRFWVNILYGIQQTNKYYTFDELYINNPKIHSGKLFMDYYGNEIFSEEAKNNWIQPTKLNN